LHKYDFKAYFGGMINMIIVPKVKLNLDKLITKALNTNTSKVHSNISIENLFKQFKTHFCKE